MDGKEVHEWCLDEFTEEDKALALKICTDTLDVPCEQCPLYERCKSGEVVEDIMSSEALDNVKVALECLGAVCRPELGPSCLCEGVIR